MFPIRLKELREEAGFSSQEKLAQRLGIRQSTVGMWENGKNIPKNSMQEKLADLFGVSVDYLLGRTDIRQNVPQNAIPYTGEKSVRVIGTVRCGVGGLAYEDMDGFELADVDNPDDYFYLRAEGDSMEPDIREGDLALVHIQDDVESGELAVVIIDGEEGTLKKIIKQGNSIVLQPFNSAYAPRIFVGRDCNNVRIAGKVIRTVHLW